MSRETDAMDFYDRVTSSEKKTRQYRLGEKHGSEVVVTLNAVDRKKLLDELTRLPDEMLETFSEAEDEEEAQELAEERGLLSGVDGNTILAFENLCAASITHEDWTQHHVEDIVTELSFEVLFEIGSQVVEMSFEEDGSITDFQRVDLDKSS